MPLCHSANLLFVHWSFFQTDYYMNLNIFCIHVILIKECYHQSDNGYLTFIYCLCMLVRHLHNILNMNIHCLFQYWVVAPNHIFGVSTFTNNQVCLSELFEWVDNYSHKLKFSTIKSTILIFKRYKGTFVFIILNCNIILVDTSKVLCRIFIKLYQQQNMALSKSCA